MFNLHSKEFETLTQEVTNFLYARKGIMKIINLPSIANKFSLIKLDSKEIKTLKDISLYGWGAYTIYDQIRDNDMHFKHNLSVANLMLGNFYLYTSRIMLENNFLIKIIQKMEVANIFEEQKNEQKITDEYILKSIGVSIPFLIYLIKTKQYKKNIKYAYDYFYYLISARQLSDDAFDWKEDMKNEKNTLVTQWLKDEAGKNKTLKYYQKVFDQIVSPKIAKTILNHSQRSIKNARKIDCFTSTSFLEELPLFYRNMSEKILDIHRSK